MSLEDSIGRRVVVVGKKSHSEYPELCVHYVGTLKYYNKTKLKLCRWNDYIFCYSSFNSSSRHIGLDTRPINEKPLTISLDEVRGTYLLDESSLISRHGREDKTIMHLATI